MTRRDRPTAPLHARARRRAHAWLTHPRTAKATRLSKQLLGIASQLGTAGKSPVALAGALGSAAEILAEVLHEGEGPIARYVEARGLEKRVCGVGELLATSGLLDDSDVAPLLDSGPRGVRLIGSEGPAGVVGFLEREFSGGERELMNVIYTSPGDGALRDFMARAVWGRLSLPALELRQRAGKWDSELVLVPMSDEPSEHLYDERVIRFADEVARYRQRGLGRAALLYGPPGTGKSTFVRSYAELTRSSLLAVGPDALAEVLGGDLVTLLDGLGPDVLLLDDLDKVSQRAALHGLLPEVRRRHPMLVVVITCNTPRALGPSFLRPGRGGELMEFGPPGPEERRRLLEHHLVRAAPERAAGVDVERVLAALDERLTHDWIRDVAEHAAVAGSTEALVAYAEQASARHRFCTTDDDDDEDDDDGDDD